MTDSTYENEALIPDLGMSIKRIQEICDFSSDLLVNKVQIAGIDTALICCEGMVSTMTITDLVLIPLSEIHGIISEPEVLYNHIDNHLLLSTDRPKLYNYGALFRLIYSGFAVLLINGLDKALAFGIQGYDKRSVTEPEGEGNVMGAHEGFIEVVRPNMSLVRRRIKSPALKLELITKGTESKTDICLCYMNDRVSQKLLDDIHASLDKLDLEVILSTGYVKPFLERRPNTLFDSIGTTERPDVFCSKLIEGRVGILVDGTPFALVIPKLFTESFQTLDDYDLKPYFATFIRWIKYFAFFAAILLPAFYVAVAIHHPELLNSKLLLILADSENNAPFSLIAEAIGVLIMYEIVREAGIRLPKAVGGAVSIVAGLIIGDAAVKSGFTATPMLTIAAAAFISGFVIPDLHPTVTILRLLFTIFGGLWGLYGISLLGAVVVFTICATEDYGYPITAPISPFTPKAMRDIAARVQFKKVQQNTFTVENLNTHK